jgi:hypothetical protein
MFEPLRVLEENKLQDKVAEGNFNYVKDFCELFTKLRALELIIADNINTIKVLDLTTNTTCVMTVQQVIRRTSFVHSSSK